MRFKKTATSDRLADDLLDGARQIGDFIGMDTPFAYYHASRGNIPVTRLGSKIIASKSVLRRMFGATPEKVA